MIGRRQFLASGISAGAAANFIVPGPAQTLAADPPPKPKIAFLGTVVYQHSHAQHFLDRLTLGYVWQGRWQLPRVEIASVYIDQQPEKDLAAERIRRHGLQQFPSVAAALTLGGSDLAVDGVVLIGEHGKYDVNERGQTKYPRYPWFKECVKVFEHSGRAVPIFNDKHLSTNWNECQEMIADSERLKFPFLAGSSLPVTWRLPSVDIPYEAPLSESVSVGYGGVDSYDIHALETAQCMSERRKGGETGIRSVQAVRGEDAWRSLEGNDRQQTRDLIVAALCRSHTLPVVTGYPSDAVTFAWARKALTSLTAYFIEHVDGFRTTMLLTNVRDFTYAGHRSDTGEVISCQMYLPMPGSSATTADFFNPLTRHLEDMILTGKSPYSAKRTLLTSGIVIAAVESLHTGHGVVETPHLQFAYHGPKESTFWRD